MCVKYVPEVIVDALTEAHVDHLVSEPVMAGSLVDNGLSKAHASQLLLLRVLLGNVLSFWIM